MCVTNATQHEEKHNRGVGNIIERGSTPNKLKLKTHTLGKFYKNTGPQEHVLQSPPKYC